MSRRTLQRAPDPHAAPPVAIATRRDLFGTMGAMLLLTAAEAGTAKVAELDGKLLATFREWQPWDRERQAVDAIYREFPDSHAPDGRHIADDRFDAYTDRWHALVQEITETPARTPEGIMVKATVLRSTLVDYGTGDAARPAHEDDITPPNRLAWSLVNDMLGRAGA